MTSQERIIYNTAAQYTRTIINVCLSLYSTRLILAALGQTDYGIFSVVAAVVAMLSFATNAFVSTTQRYLSFNHGKGDRQQVYEVFGNSVLLHQLIAFTLLLILIVLARPLIYHVLSIAPERLHAAVWVYAAATAMVCLSFITAPFRALFIARENIIYISIIDIIDGVLRLVVAIFLTYVAHYDKLITYSCMLVGISLFDLAAFAAYSLLRYEECHLPRFIEWNKTHIANLSGFAGWTMYTTGSVIARTQGVAILLNRAFGSVMNAAYGIALQVNGATAFIAQAIINSMSPQIVGAAGQGLNNRVLELSAMASKYAITLFSLFAIPLIAEMDAVLRIWLGETPEYTAMFCNFILLSCIVDLTTIGLTIANQATGDIKYFSLITSTIKLLTLPAAWICLRVGWSCTSVMWCFVVFEGLCAFARLPYIMITQGLSLRYYMKTVLARVIFPIAISSTYCIMIKRFVEWDYRPLLTIIGSGLIFVVCAYCIVLSKQERQFVKNMFVK